MNPFRCTAIRHWFVFNSFVAAIFCSATLQAIVHPELDPNSSRADKVKVERDEANGVTRIFLPAEQGKVSWADVSESILKYIDQDTELIDLSSLKTRTGMIDLNSRISQITLKAMDIAVGDRLDFEILDSPPRLLIKIRHESATSNFQLAKSKLRQILLSRNNGLKAAYGISIPDLKGRQRQGHSNELCLFVHGLNSRCKEMKPLAEKVKSHGFQVAYFDYPNDDRISSSAELLSKELRKLKNENPKLKIHIVAHSMGGLVARQTIEDERLDPGNVKSLIMIFTPNHGSNLAKIAIGLDLWEHFLDKGTDPAPILSKIKLSIADGLNDACKDLKPDSPFLKKLNQMKRNPEVNYSAFVGTDALVTSQQLDAVLKKAKNFVGNTIAQHAMAYARKKLENLDEVVKGLGDGIVSVKSATISGVADIEKFKMTHRKMWLAPNDASSQELFEAVIKRLE